MAKTETRDKDGVLDSREAGLFLREILTERGLQIQQLAELTTVPDPDYLSNLLSGRINVGKSKHFPSIARALGLNAEDVAYINPNLIVQVVPTPSNRVGPPVPPIVQPLDLPLDIPAELQRVIDRHGRDYPELLNETTLRALVAPRLFAGHSQGPQTSDQWLEYFLMNRRWFPQ